MTPEAIIEELQTVGDDLAAALANMLGLPVTFAPLDPRETLQRWHELQQAIREAR